MKMATGSNIRTLRNLAGLTLEQLSVLSGVEVGTISALENRDSARSKYFTAIAQAFGISTDDLSSEITSDQLERAAQMQYQMRVMTSRHGHRLKKLHSLYLIGLNRSRRRQRKQSRHQVIIVCRSVEPCSSCLQALVDTS